MKAESFILPLVLSEEPEEYRFTADLLRVVRVLS
jgi:hypothetical protein